MPTHSVIGAAGEDAAPELVRFVWIRDVLGQVPQLADLLGLALDGALARPRRQRPVLSILHRERDGVSRGKAYQGELLGG
jgi:hypothetical protein